MQADIESMGVRLGQLQEKNFKLEEKVNALLDEIAMASDELEAKELLIKSVVNSYAPLPVHDLTYIVSSRAESCRRR
jgi:hypothetical protein